MEENITKIENVVRTYKNGKFVIIVSHNPNGKSFQELALNYFKAILNKELGN